MATEEKGDLRIFDTLLTQRHDVCAALHPELLGVILFYNRFVSGQWDDCGV
jgi:hypothetical protein